MNKKLIFVLIVVALIMSACSFTPFSTNQVVGSGKLISETRSVSSFSSVELKGSADITITFGSTESVVVAADDNIVPLISTSVLAGRLVIDNKFGANYTTHNSVRVSITMKSLQGITLSGSGNINVTGLNADTLTVNLPGSGNITASGTANKVNVSLDGSGNVYCDQVTAKDATTTLRGSGNVTVYASESLDASIPGSGSIRYSGNPSRMNKSVTGSGSITP
jgi:hypothetical protein